MLLPLDVGSSRSSSKVVLVAAFGFDGPAAAGLPRSALGVASCAPQKLHITSPGCALPPHTGHATACAGPGAPSSAAPVALRGPPTEINALPSASQNRSLSAKVFS